jgi:hypothetical protein
MCRDRQGKSVLRFLENPAPESLTEKAAIIFQGLSKRLLIFRRGRVKAGHDELCRRCLILLAAPPFLSNL